MFVLKILIRIFLAIKYFIEISGEIQNHAHGRILIKFRNMFCVQICQRYRGGSPGSNVKCTAENKVSVFVNGQFSGQFKK